MRVCSTPSSDAPLTSSTAVHPVSHQGAAAPAVCSAPSSDVADSSSTAVDSHRSPSLSSPPPVAAAARRSPSPSAHHAHFSWSNAAHRRALSQLVLLVADVGCVSELFPICLIWADRLYEENTLGQSYVRQTAAAASRPHRTSCPHEVHHAKKAREDSTTAAAQEEKQREEDEEAARAEEAEAAAAVVPFVSQYILETADLPSAVAAAAAAASSSAASAAAVSSSPPSHPLPPDPLSSFYASQHGFLHGYAMPLFALLHDSGLLPRPLSSQLYPQLQFNLRVLAITEVTKPASPSSSKIRLQLRRGKLIDEQAREDIERIKREYQACAEFHRQLCRQKEDPAASASPPHTATTDIPWPQRSTPVHSLQFIAD